MKMDEILKALKERRLTPSEAKILMDTEHLSEAVAVVGMSGKYAQADDLNAYWEMLCHGREAVREVPHSRWDADAYFDAEHGKSGKMYSKWAGFIEDVESFDAMFFSIVPTEAAIMDPQQRMFMEEGYKAFEDAGYCKRTLDGANCGIYFGIIKSEYDKILENSALNGTITGGSSAIAAARLSYFLNLKGPAISLDTACSSSLVGLHLAVQALVRNEIDMALVGGSSLYLTPEAFINMCQAGMLSSDGHCKAFDAAADGFVPGEGVSAVVVKRLEDAVWEHDHIYGIIIASGINQDGHTNGITAPSRQSQYQLIQRIYQQYHIQPADISYAEMHGTGTSLGDPIELEALNKVFLEAGCAEHSCRIGSVKSNIGHTTAAAGIAGLQKILLCMQHHQLVPTLNVKQLNPKFDFAHSAFLVNTETIPWQGDASHPLRACLSSFGYSGTNSHVVAEEYFGTQCSAASASDGLFLLSAATAEALQRYVQKNEAFLRNTAVSWTDYLYTLQCGRDAMKHRLAVVASDVQDLLQKLSNWQQGIADPMVYSGVCSAQKMREAALDVKEHDTQALQQAASAWVNGVSLCWDAFYANQKPYHVPVPAYPFEKERFPIQFEKQHPSAVPEQDTEQFVLYQNDAVIQAHQTEGKIVVPGAVLLNAFCHCIRKKMPSSQMCIRDLVWNYPYTMQSNAVHMRCTLGSAKWSEAVSFAVMPEHAKYTIPCMEGMVECVSAVQDVKERIPLQEWKRQAEGSIGQAAFYQMLCNGIQYGEALQTVHTLYYGTAFVLAELSDHAVQTNETDFSPALLDGAFQALCGFAFSAKAGQQAGAWLPSSVKRIVFYGTLPQSCYVLAMPKAEKADAFDLLLTDADGFVCMKIESLQVARKTGEQSALMAAVPCRTAYVPQKMECFGDSVLRMQFVSESCAWNIPYDPTAVQVVCGSTFEAVCDRKYRVNPLSEAAWEALFSAVSLSDDTCIEIDSMIQPPQSETGSWLFQVYFQLAHFLMCHAGKCSIRLNHMYVSDDSLASAENAALAGFFAVIRHEHPNFRFSTVAYCGSISDRNAFYHFLTALHEQYDTLPLDTVYENGKWYTMQLQQTILPQAQPFFRSGGTYLITGGLGKLGMLTAAHILSKYQGNVILVGSRAMDAAMQKQCESLQLLGGSVRYLQGDLSNREAAAKLAAQIPMLNGIIAAAGITKDALIRNQNVQDAMRVAAVKIGTSRFLDEAFADRKLDFFVMYSSISSVLGTVGQGNYSYANSYLNHYAQYRNQLRLAGKRSGLSLAVGWPYWAVDGMHMEEQTAAYLQKACGMIPLPAEVGLQALEQLGGTSDASVMLFYGNAEKIQRFLSESDDAKTSFSGQEQQPKRADRTRLIAFLKKKISDTTKIAVSKISEEDSFELYGIDSIVMMAIIRSLEESFGELPKTLLFENQNIAALADDLLLHYHDAVEKMFPAQSEAEKMPIPQMCANAVVTHSETHMTAQEAADDIAIIGLDGRYPCAETLEAFWENLLQAKDCVTEIPKERWDADAYYSTEAGAVGKCNSKWGGFLQDIEMFDPLFFQMTPLEAEYTDPQSRLFLETVWHAMEDAGYTRTALRQKKVGVFVGVMYGLYQLVENSMHLTGNASYASIANRVSYFFDFKGPSIAIDTMCSSSLTAVHLACRSILSGECDMAVAGGVNLILHPNKYVQLSQSHFTATDGKCRAFGSGGDGYVPGEGVGAVILKSKKAAVRDHDRIYAVIRGSAVNAGGKSNGFTVPNPQAQSDVIREAMRQAGVCADEISCVEAHGTGTALGDPIEISSITKVFRENTKDTQYCSIGSVKSNIGHCEGAAGMAALTKVLLEMQHQTLVPSIHSDILNPYIDFASTPFYVQQVPTAWQPRNGKRIAGISAFGAGGSNAHLILEAYCEEEQSSKENDGETYLFPLSARTNTALKEYAAELLSFLRSDMETDGSSEHQPQMDEIRRYVMRKAAEVLDYPITETDLATELSEFGMDCVAAEQICSAITQKYQITLEEDSILHCRSLQQWIQELSDALQPRTEQYTKPKQAFPFSMADLSYTMLTGRESMQHRLCFAADSMETLCRALQDYCDGKENAAWQESDVSEMSDQVRSILHDEAFSLCIQNALDTRNWAKLEEYWLMGAGISWDAMFAGISVHRIRMPQYPFAKMRCWLVSEAECTQLAGLTHLADGNPVSQQNVADVQSIPQSVQMAKAADLQQYAAAYVQTVFAAVLKVPMEELSVSKEFQEYGIDSIYISQLNAYFENVFEGMPSSVFFKYKTIRAFAAYLTEQYPEVLMRLRQEEQGIEPLPTETAVPKRPMPSVQQESAQPLAGTKVPIAIIGISGQYPKSENLREYTENLMHGTDCISEIPKERWDAQAYPQVQCRWGGFLEHIDRFDPQFFGIAPMNALYMDPQERLFLEKVWECMEDAGYVPSETAQNGAADNRGNVSVFAGVSFNTYCLDAAAEMRKGNILPINSQIYSVANRVSYTLNFSGESLSVDTACSSSLYAMYLGCRSLWEQESEMSLVGGVNLSLHPSKYLELDMSGFLAKDGHCHSFGVGGSGYVPGEGVGVFLLKPLWKAEQDHDHIYGVIRGIAANHGGKTHGYTVPNPNAQTEVIEKALHMAKISPRTISYVEAHGTGTALGDPIEVDALQDAFGKETAEKAFCRIGSVKSNIGHLEAAAGVSQVTKVLMQFAQKKIFPTRLNAEAVNPNIDFARTAFRLPLTLETWEQPVVDGKGYPRRAGVSSFGVGGVNVHLILEEYENNASANEKMMQVVPLSAKSETALRAYVRNYLDWLREKEKPDWNDFVFTLQQGRSVFPYRLAVCADDYETLMQEWNAFLNGSDSCWLYHHADADKAEQTIDAADGNNTLQTLAARWTEGYTVDWQQICPQMAWRVPLPTYPFERERYWMYDLLADAAEQDATAEEQVEAVVLPTATASVSETDQPPKYTDTAFLEEYYTLFDSEKADYVSTYLQHMFAQLLGFPKGKLPEKEQGFFDMGLESLTSNNALAQIEGMLGMTLDVQMLFNYPNIMKLTAYLIPLADANEEAFSQWMQGGGSTVQTEAAEEVTAPQTDNVLPEKEYAECTTSQEEESLDALAAMLAEEIRSWEAEV